MPRRFKIVGRDIVHRWEGNPLIGLDDLDFKCSDIHNAGVAIHEGKTLLLVTVEDLTGSSGIHLARETEHGHFQVERKPFMSRSHEPSLRGHESGGRRDARVTKIDGTYYIMYLAEGDHGYRIGLARTQDFVDVECLGLISAPDTKGGALFPEKIGGRFARICRPGDGRSLWVSYSEDLTYWGGMELIIRPRGGYWTRAGSGSGPLPC